MSDAIIVVSNQIYKEFESIKKTIQKALYPEELQTDPGVYFIICQRIAISRQTTTLNDLIPLIKEIWMKLQSRERASFILLCHREGVFEPPSGDPKEWRIKSELPELTAVSEAWAFHHRDGIVHQAINILLSDLRRIKNCQGVYEISDRLSKKILGDTNIGTFPRRK